MMRTTIQQHELDLDIDPGDELDLFAEEMPDQVQMLSDCLSSASSASCDTCAASFGSVGSVISCG